MAEEQKSLGEIAWQGYSQKTGGKDPLTSAPLPGWGAHLTHVRDAWESAGQAVASYLGRNPPSSQPVKPEEKAYTPPPTVPDVVTPETKPANAFTARETARNPAYGPKKEWEQT